MQPETTVNYFFSSIRVLVAVIFIWKTILNCFFGSSGGHAENHHHQTNLRQIEYSFGSKYGCVSGIVTRLHTIDNYVCLIEKPVFLFLFAS